MTGMPQLAGTVKALAVGDDRTVRDDYANRSSAMPLASVWTVQQENNRL